MATRHWISETITKLTDRFSAQCLKYKYPVVSKPIKVHVRYSGGCGGYYEQYEHLQSEIASRFDAEDVRISGEQINPDEKQFKIDIEGFKVVYDKNNGDGNLTKDLMESILVDIEVRYPIKKINNL